MKKQKFEVYAEPIWKNMAEQSRAQNQSKLSKPSKKKMLKRGKSYYKNPDLSSKKQAHQLPCIKSSEQENHQLLKEKDSTFQIDLYHDTFLQNSNKNPPKRNLSLKKNVESQNLKLYQSNQKRNVTSSLNQRSSVKFNGFATWSKKQFRELKLNNLAGSPYLRNPSDLQKIVKFLQPVKGPNESIKKQIIQYNGQHKKNHELVVMRRPNQTFEMKRKIYLERIGFQSTSKVFVMNSRDYHIREALIRRGWIELKDISDNFFHLKWMYSDSPSDYAALNYGQLFNHFHNNQQLTNKNNLRKNIKSCLSQNQSDVPLTFDLGIGVEFKRFVETAMILEGVKILNLIINWIKLAEPKTYTRIRSNPNYFKHFDTKKNCQTKVSGTSTFDFIGNKHQQQEKQVQILTENTFKLIAFLAKTVSKQASIKYSLYQNAKKPQKKNDILMILRYFQQQIQKKTDLTKLNKFLKVQLFKIHFHLSNLKTIYKKCYGTENSWIIKPTGVSRGTGIYIESDFKNLLSQENNQHGKIVQKYIERPFLLRDKRKFDLRQWVLVRSFEPFEVYIYRRLYGRICPQKYVNSEFDNKQIHLTNYSLSREFYKSRDHTSSSFNQDMQRGSALSHYVNSKKVPSTTSIILQQDLIKYIESDSCKSSKTWRQIKLQIKQNIIKTLRCCSPNIEQSPNCFQVYGFDILLDEELNPFVIQVNLSPACERREGLEVYLEEMSDGLVGYFEKWVKTDERKTVCYDKKGEIWERLYQSKIDEQLRQINEQKLKNDKARIIQKWLRSLVRRNGK